MEIKSLNTLGLAKEYKEASKPSTKILKKAEYKGCLSGM